VNPINVIILPHYYCQVYIKLSILSSRCTYICFV